ncbi:MAG TPA: serine/threonine-protein kinase [Acidobacteriota bacterium]|nr:serine/threonine-protein kinase [Acidobacteriota bacterium]
MLSKGALQRLRELVEEPDLEGSRYQLLERIGQGGMGTVFLAEDSQLQRKVALKVMNVVDASGDLTARMWKEARILASLEHPGIVPIHDVGSLPDGRVFYAMKYVQGNRLDEYLKNEITQAELLRVFEKICEAVAFANAHGVLHRDLKPENIMVGQFGEVLVMDWGIAKLLQESEQPVDSSSQTTDGVHTQKGTIIGTRGYMSPEQQQGNLELDQRTDVYSLGAILYFLLTREHPYTEPLQIPSKVPKRLAAICRKAMATAPEDRYSTANELGTDIARFIDHQPVSAYNENVLERAARWVDRNRFVVYLILTYLLLRFLVLLFLKR